MLTRTFAALYFQNTRFSHHNQKSVETAVSHSRLVFDAEEKVALSLTVPTELEEVVVNKEEVVVDNQQGLNSIEMSKMSEANGSNEALIPTGANVQALTINQVSTVNQESANKVL